MKVRGLDGEWHTWKITLKNKVEAVNKSEFHITARGLLKKIYPNFLVLEEVFLPGSGLYADFYIPSLKMIIEVHGQQHYEFNPFFHGSKSNFMAAKQRDTEKRQWCLLNNIKYIELPYNESIDEWKTRILDRS